MFIPFYSFVSYHFLQRRVVTIFKLLIKIRNKTNHFYLPSYREALLKQNADLVDRFLRSDNLKGMRIWDKNQESQYEKIRFIKRALKKQGSSYPKELPFSESIFKVHLKLGFY